MRTLVALYEDQVVGLFNDHDRFFDGDEMEKDWRAFASGYWWAMRAVFKGRITVEAKVGDTEDFVLTTGTWGGPDIMELR